MVMNDESKSRQNVAAALVSVKLDESDILGAALSDPLEGHTIPELKWWLLCQVIKPSSSPKNRSARQETRRKPGVIAVAIERPDGFGITH